MNADDIDFSFEANWGLADHQWAQLSLWVDEEENLTYALIMRSDLDPRHMQSLKEWAAIAMNQVVASGDPIANGWNHSASERGGWYMTAALHDLPGL